MAYTQDNRSIAIATPLDKDKLLLKSCTISEQLGRPFVIKAQLLSEEPAIDFLELIGKGVAIRWEMPDSGSGAKKRYFSGYVSSFLQRPQAEGFYNYEATIVPWLWFLTRTADCRIFHSAMSNPPDEMTVPGIIKKVFKDHGFDDVTPSLNGSYRTMDHCTQYRETDFNFVSRLMEQEGIYYFFEHVDEGGTIKHKLKLVDAMSAHAEFPDYATLPYLVSSEASERKGSILSWSRIKQVQPGTYKVNDFDFKRPKASLLGSGSKDRSHANSAFEIYDYSANFADEEPEDHGEFYGKVRIDELQAQHDVILGTSDCPGLACGSKFTLEGHPREDENADYVVVGVTYRCLAESYKTSAVLSAGVADQGRYLCDFTAIPSDAVYRPARVTPKPHIYGPQTAIVVGKAGEEIHTDEFGRIKVQFHWDRYSPANENTPCWVRLSQMWAGKNWGAVFLPRIGQEVIVEFLDGNPDRPIVTGCVYNGESKPPYPLPDNATMSTIKSNSSMGGQGFNEFRFEDKKGEEMIFTHAEKDQDIRVKNDTKEWIGNDRHLVVKAKQTELVEGDKGAEVKGDQLLKVGGDMGSNITGNQITKIGGNLHANVSSAIHLKAGADIRLSAGANADIKGGAVIVIEGGAQLSLKAGGSFVDIGPAGVSISGAMVNINSGGAAGTAQDASPESPDAPSAAAEASDAEPGSSNEAATAPTPPTPTQFSASCIAMQEAAESGTPLAEG
jgi:type VI secretion system secreted protein VgrG